MATTPILDLDQPPPPMPGKLYLCGIGFASGAVTLLFLILRDTNRLPQWHWPGVNGLLLLPLLWLGIAVHEASHAIAGRLVGLEFGGIAVGGFVFTKSGTRWTCRFELRFLLDGFFWPLSGSVGFELFKWAWMIAAGPCASASLALLSGLLCSQYGSGHWAWLGTLLWTSLFLSAGSIFPFSSGAVRSDGARLWQFVRHPRQAQSFMALMLVQTENTGGTLPRSWSRVLFEEMLRTPPSEPEYAYCQLLAFYRRIDEGAEIAALQHLESALSRLPRAGKPLRQVIFIEAACASAGIRKNPEQAREWRKRAIALMKPRSLDALDAEIAISEGRFEAALKHLEAAHAHLDKSGLDSGLARFAREQWAQRALFCRAALVGTDH